MITLGINAAYHDSAASLVVDGMVVAAAEEERFTGIKHGKRPIPFSAYELPFHAIDYCLREGGISIADVDHVAYSFDPSLLLNGRRGQAEITLPLEPSAERAPDGWESVWDPLFVSLVVNAPRQLEGGVPLHLRKRLVPGRDAGGHRYQWHFVEHHQAHAASAYLPSPFDEAAILTIDGRGERATTTYSLGRGGRIERIGQVDMPHSLGLLYERLTDHLGFLHSSDEYKVMALAAYGRPLYRDRFRELVSLEREGEYTVASLDPETLAYYFGPKRERGTPLEQRHYDVARSLQEILEERILGIAAWLRRRTRTDYLCFAGGVALNCVLNARLRDAGLFREVWVQPAASDAGTALGAALLVDSQERSRGGPRYRMSNAFLGPSYDEGEIETALRVAKVCYERPADIVEAVACRLADDQIVGWFQGRMEFGPRALGSRSILASPLKAGMKDRLNEIKDREDFRPVAPMVPEEDAAAWFKDAVRSPFMLFVNEVHSENAERIPAVTHVDGTARIQTVSREDLPLVHRLLKRFEALTGVPVIVNTSFNTQGKPIVCSPRDALECFWTSPLDCLAIGPFLVEKAPASGQETAIGRQETAGP